MRQYAHASAKLTAIIFSSALLALFTSLPASATEASLQKLNSPLRAMLKAPKARLKALSKMHGVDPERRTAKVMIRLKPGIKKESLALDPGIKLGAQGGPVVTAEVPFDLLETLADHPDVERVSLSIKYKLLNDIARSSTMSGGLYLGMLSPQGTAGLGVFNGTGVVVGIVDTGIDFRHGDFINGTPGTTGASSRILYFWDQEYTPSSPPSGYSYGKEWTQSQMTTDVRNSNCTGNTATTNCTVKSIDTDGHGTAVAGCAAGDGSATNGNEPAGKYTGIAPAADIIMVKSDLSDTSICEGTEYIFNKAAALGKPAVVNLSLGGHLGPHDGASVLETCLTSLTGAGKIIVAAAGNEGADKYHASATIGAGANDTITLDFKYLYEDEDVDFWHDGGDAFTIQITADGAGGSVTVTSGNYTHPSSANLGTAFIDVDNAVPGNIWGAGLNGAKEIYIHIYDPDMSLEYYHFKLTRTQSSGSGRVDGWTGIMASSPFYDHVDYSMSVGMPGTAPGIITAGAYTTKTSWYDVNNTFQSFPATLGAIADFSSRGPSRDGRTKPEIAAPGDEVQTSKSQNSSPAPEQVAYDFYHRAIAGTSFASPLTAGAVALRLQQNKTLTTSQVLTALEGLARTDTQVGTIPNNTWGYGKVLATPPAYPAPTGFVASALSSTTIRWTWNDISNEEGYRLRRSSDSSVIASLAANTTQTDQTGLSPNTWQQAVVEAYNVAGSSPSVSVKRYTLAAAPASLTVTAASSTTISLSWSANGNATGTPFELSLSLDGFSANFSTPVAFGANLTASATTVSGLSLDTMYYFRVRARNGDFVASSPSNVASAKTVITPPTVPSLNGTALGTSSISWTWGLAAGATAYNLYNAANNASLGSTTSLSFVRTNLSTNTAYGLKVAGTNVNGQGPLGTGSTVYTLAAAPSSLAVASVSSTTAALSWSAAGNPSGTPFEISASLDGFAANFSTPVPFGSNLTASPTTLYGLNPGATYAFRVRARNGDLFPTSFSNISSTTTNHVTPPVVTVSGTALGATSVTWNWGLAAGATAYNLYNAANNASLGSTTSLSFVRTNLSTNTAYGLKVAGTNVTGQGPLGTGSTVYTLASTPVSLSVDSVTFSNASLSWSANGNPSGTPYEVTQALDSLFTTGVLTPVPFTANLTNAATTVYNLSPETPYYFRVRALNGDTIATAFSNTSSATTYPPPPPAVVLNGTVLGTSSISWTWGLAAGATAYNLYDATSGASLGSTTSLSLVRTNLSTNTAYGLKVAGTNVNGQGPLSPGSTVYTLAASPVSPALVSLGISSAAASWDANGNPGGTVFSLELSFNAFGTVSASSRTIASSARFDGLPPDTSCHLRVKAENGDGLSTAYTASLTTPTLAAPPSGLTLTQLSGTSLRAAWLRAGNPSDTPFEVGLSTDNFALNFSTPLPFSFLTLPKKDLADLLVETTYYVRVRARSRGGITTAFAAANLFLAPDLVQPVDPDAEATLSFANAVLTVPPQAFSEAVTVTLHSPASYPAAASYAGTMAATGVGIEIKTNMDLLPSRELGLTLDYSGTLGITDETLVVIARYDTSRAVWVPLASVPDPALDRVTAMLDHLSLFQVMQLQSSGRLSSAVVKVFPNPVHPSRGQTMKFTGLPVGATLKIYTYRGDLVRELTAGAGGMATWNGRNSSGNPAASGVYLVLIKAGGEKKTVKVMVER